jgi:hypothetical protein
MAERKFDAALSSYRDGHSILEKVVATSPNNVQWQLHLLWSHSRLALLGDDSTRRFRLIVTTLSKLKDENKLAPAHERWLPVANDGLAAMRPDNPQWQTDLVSILWRAAPFAENPVRQAALLVAVLRKLEHEGKLRPEQSYWLPKAEAQLAMFRQQ